MRDPSDIETPEDLEAFLNDWPEEDGPGGLSRQQAATWIAWRAAMRALPIYWDWVHHDGRRRNHALSVLPVLQAFIVSNLRARSPDKSLDGVGHNALSNVKFAREIVYDAHHSAVARDNKVRIADIERVDAVLSAIEGCVSIHAKVKPTVNDLPRSIATFGSRLIEDAMDIASADIDQLVDAGAISDTALWQGELNPLEDVWLNLKRLLPRGGSDETALGAVPEDWSFWIKWYDDALAGREPNWAMLKEIALIPSETWEQGPVVVNPLINDIWDKYRGDDPTDLDAQVARLPKPSNQIVERVRNSMQRNRKELPPTFDAIESLILLEIERLQNRNFRDHEDQEEAIRQIGVYLSLHTAIAGLRANLPVEGEVTAQQAEATERLWTLYRNKFAALPREKADEVVEGVWDAGVGAAQFGLITGSAYLGMLYGVPIGASLPVAGVCFAPKKAGDLINAAKEMLPGK